MAHDRELENLSQIEDLLRKADQRARALSSEVRRISGQFQALSKLTQTSQEKRELLAARGKIEELRTLSASAGSLMGGTWTSTVANSLTGIDRVFSELIGTADKWVNPTPDVLLPREGRLEIDQAGRTCAEVVDSFWRNQLQPMLVKVRRDREEIKEREQQAKEPTPPMPARQPTEQRNASKKGQWIGNWRVLKNLKAGGQGQVSLVEHRDRYERGVLKRLAEKHEGNEKALQRLEREIRLLRKLEHPCIVRVLGQSLKPGEPYLVTQWAPYGSAEGQKALFYGDCWRVLRLARDVALGLGAAHDSEIVHRDVKPANILLMTLSHSAIADFGIAHLRDEATLTGTDENVGAQWFRPPEAESGRIDTPEASFDVYGLGKVIYYLLSGGKRFRREGFRQPECDLRQVCGREEYEAVNELLDQMVVEDPKARLQTMDRVIQAIDQCLRKLSGWVRDQSVQAGSSESEVGTAEAERRPRSSPDKVIRNEAQARRAHRLALIGNDKLPVQLPAGARTIVHAFPSSVLDSRGEDDLLAAYSDRLKAVPPLSNSPGDSGHLSTFNDDGILNYWELKDTDQGLGYALLGRSGWIEAVDTLILPENKKIPGRVFVEAVARGVNSYLEACQEIGLDPPFYVGITLLRVHGFWVETSASRHGDSVPGPRSRPIDRGELRLPIQVIVSQPQRGLTHSGEDEIAQALRSAFDRLWQASGLPRCEHFDDQGVWRPTW